MNPSLKMYTTGAESGLKTVSWSDTVASAFGIMNEHNVRHLPVIHDSGSIIGILSERDCERAIHVDSVDFFSPRAPQAHFNPDSLVRDFMSWPVEVIDLNAPITDAAKVMIAKKISSLLVVSGMEMRGILTSEDLLRMIVDENEISLSKSTVTKTIRASDVGAPSTSSSSNSPASRDEESDQGDAYTTVKYANSVGSIAQFFANVGI